MISQSSGKGIQIERGCKFQFDLQLIRLEANVPIQSQIEVVWKRGPNNISTRNSFEVRPNVKDTIINEVLSLISPCNLSEGEFLSKQSELVVCININGVSKKLGKYALDLVSILNPHDYQNGSSRIFEAELAKPALKDGAKLIFKLSSIYLGDSGIEKSVGKGLDPLKSSNFLGRDKDSMSIASYAGPNVRYTSSNKADSAKKEDYGLKSREYGLVSHASTRLNPTGEYQSKNRLRSIDNRTENNDGNNQRQLTEEQNRRSKLEAELNKNVMYIEELKKKLNQMIMTNAKQKEEANASASQLKEALEANKQLRRDVDNWKSKCEGSSKEIAMELKTEKDRLSEQSRMDSARVNDLLKQVEYYKAESRNHEQQAASQRQQLSRVMEEGRRKVDELKIDASMKNEDSNRKFEESYRKLEESKRKTVEMERELQRKTEQMNRRMEEMNRQVVRKAQELKRVGSQLEAEKTVLQTQKGVLQTEKGVLQTEISSLRRELSGKQMQVSSKQIQLSTMVSEKSKLSQKVNALTQQLQGKANLLMKTEREARDKQSSLENEYARLKEESRQLREQKDNTKVTAQSAEMTRLLREAMQMQVEIRFLRQESQRLKKIEEQSDQFKWKADIEIKNRLEIEKSCEVMEKELVGKNRALIIQNEKCKMLEGQLQEAQQALASMQTAEEGRVGAAISERNKLEKQLLNAEHYIATADERNNLLVKQLQKLSQNRTQVDQATQRTYEMEIIQTKNALDQKCKELAGAQITIGKLRGQLSQMIGECAHLRGLQTGMLEQERRGWQKKVEMMNEEMQLMKKKYDEGKSVKSEEVSRVRSLQNEIEKREKVISKLSKEKLELQEQNVKINVKVMKLLSEMEKNKKK